jgi:hypothetical protein
MCGRDLCHVAVQRTNQTLPRALAGRLYPIRVAYTLPVMAEKESTSEQLRREAQKLRETAIDLMEHAALNTKKEQGRVK